MPDRQNKEVTLLTMVDERQARTIIGGGISICYALLALVYQSTIFCVLLLALVPCNYLAVKLIKKPLRIVMFGYFFMLSGWIFILIEQARFSVSLRHFL